MLINEIFKQYIYTKSNFELPRVSICVLSILLFSFSFETQQNHILKKLAKYISGYIKSLVRAKFIVSAKKLNIAKKTPISKAPISCIFVNYFRFFCFSSVTYESIFFSNINIKKIFCNNVFISLSLAVDNHQIKFICNSLKKNHIVFTNLLFASCSLTVFNFETLFLIWHVLIKKNKIE